ncbi:MAG: hypothetical protein ABSD39_21715 [Terriglobales bacterium]|jgi:hypothetical protein
MAGFLMLVMLGPAFGPFAMAEIAPPAGMRCMRRPMAEVPAAAPAMRCHHEDADRTASRNSESQHAASSPEASFRSLDCCCGHCNYDCCCRTVRTSGWAKPASNHLSPVSLPIENALPSPLVDDSSAVLLGPDSARAPPRR